jgi:hypothetical protein
LSKSNKKLEKARKRIARRNPLGPRHPLDDSLLGRHRAKILRPEDAVPSWDGTPVQHTIYRYEYLLVPQQHAIDDGFRNFLNRAARPVNVEFPPPRRDLAGTDRRLARLVPAPDVTQRRPIDAWQFLQAVHAAAARDGDARVRQVEDISLDHVLTGGVPPKREIEGTPGKEGHSWGPSRIPALLSVDPPPVPTTGPRPVVAVLDTGCWTQHPWLTNSVTVMNPPQGSGLQTTDLASDLVEPLLGLTDSHAGHGTFCCGLIRQIAPNARIVVYPVMHSDGVVVQSDLEHQLQVILNKVGSTPPPADFIDVVLMPLGGYAESFTGMPALEKLLDDIAKKGVVLIASAGNDASREKMYPAAFGNTIGVGALTRRETAAIYSNEAQWVDTWYPGSSVVSTVPEYAGSMRPGLSRPDELGVALRKREGFDPDDLSYSFGVWSGTSFAAAICAARAAYYLSRQPPLGAAGLAPTDRAAKVWDAVKKEGQDETWPT